MLDTGEDSVSNALRHARANLQKRLSPPGDPHLPRIRGPNEPSSNIWLLRTRLGTLLPWWRCLPKMSSFTAPLADMQFVGPGAAGRLFEAIFAQARSYRLIDTRANEQPALASMCVTRRPECFTPKGWWSSPWPVIGSGR